MKLFFNRLTHLIDNFGEKLAQVISMIVSLRSFKLTTGLKRLADFFGFESSDGKGRLKTKWDKTKAWFSPNRMTQQAAQEKEKYEQQRADTSERRSRNEVVNSNNKVVDALNRNADALDRNSNAQNAKREAQSAASTSTPNAPPVKSWATEYGSLNGKYVYKTSDGKWKYGNGHNIDDANATNIKLIASPAGVPAVSTTGTANEQEVKDPSRFWLAGLTGSTIVSGGGLFGIRASAAKKALFIDKQIEDLKNGPAAFGDEDLTRYRITELKNQRNNIYKKYGFSENEDLNQIIQDRQLRVQELKANWKQSAIRGVGTGLTAGVVAGMTAEGDVQDKIVAGASTAITTGLLSAIPGVGVILGPILGPVLGGFLGKEINKLLKADEIARKERVQQAKDNLEAIKGVSTSVTGLIDIRKKGDTSLWDADDWKQANEYVESINKAAKASEAFSKAIGVGITNIEEMTEAELADIEAARIKYEAEQTYAAGEQDRYTLMKEISENQKKVNDKDASVAKQAQAAIVSATAQLDEYRDALRDSYLQSAFYSSHVSAMSSVDISSATLDRVIMEIAREWAEKGVSDVFGAGGSLTSSARTDIVSFLREQSGYESLFNNKSKDVYEIKNALGLFGGDKALIEELKGLAQNQDINKVTARLQELGKLGDKYKLSELNNLIDKINTADTTSIATIAHSLNMTVEQFERANKDGAFDWLTTEDALNGADKFLEKMTSLSSIFADLSKNAALSSENIQKVFSSYRFLLRGENGEMSIENIAKNLGDIFLNGINSQAAQTYIGLRISDAMSDRNLWKAFVSDETVMAGLSDADIAKLKAASTYESGGADIVEGNEVLREKFWKLAAESAGEMDLFKEMRDILVEYQTSTYDTEISNLESIKDALGDVNKQREKELELIKAKEALENASKEKKRVYREGVGFVYTTDQEAVKSAQEKVDELEQQKTQDDIQYQIDVLEQQKSILESVAKNEEIVALKESIDKFFGGVTASNLIDAIFATNDPEKQAALRAEIASSGSMNAADIIAEKKEIAKSDAVKKYEEAYEEFKKKYWDENEAFKFKDTDILYKSASNAALDDITKLTELRADAIAAGADPEGLVPNVTANNYGGSARTSYGQTEVKVGQDRNDELGTSDSKKWAATTDLTTDEIFQKGFGSGSVLKGDEFLILELKNGTYQLADEQLGSKDLPLKSIDEVKNKLSPGQILFHDRNGNGRWDYAIYKGFDGNIYNMGDSGHVWINRGSTRLADTEYYASGTLSSSCGPSLINENGLESIITPQGTITSLPAKSGIVPADLTRNLWALGEVAPNLIARLGGSNLQTNNSSSATDNSINIDNLVATFNTDSGFDGQEFLESLKREVILTRNNH